MALRKLLRDIRSQFEGLSNRLTAIAARGPIVSCQPPSDTKEDCSESLSKSRAVSKPPAPRNGIDEAQMQHMPAVKQNVRPAFKTDVTELTQGIWQATHGCLPASESKYVPPFSKSLLESLLAALPPDLRQKAKKQAKKKLGSSNSKRDLFGEVVRQTAEYNRNLLYRLPGKSLGEVQEHLFEKGRLVYVAESKIPDAGRGVFAKVPIQAGSLITQYIPQKQLLNAPWETDSSPITCIEEAYEVSSGKAEQKFDYCGEETSWPVYAIPPLINDHSSLKGCNWAAYVDGAPQVTNYLAGIAALNNVALVERWGKRFMFATRDIKERDELLWTYGLSWWLGLDRKKLLMILLFYADEMKGLFVNQEILRAYIQETWLTVRSLEAVAQAGIDKELELVGRYGPRKRKDVQPLKPIPAEYEDINFLRNDVLPESAKLLQHWKEMLTKRSLKLLYSGLYSKIR